MEAAMNKTIEIKVLAMAAFAQFWYAYSDWLINKKAWMEKKMNKKAFFMAVFDNVLDGKCMDFITKSNLFICKIIFILIFFLKKYMRICIE